MEGAIPESVMEAVNRTSKNMQEFKSQFLEFLSQCDSEVLAEMEPLQRAKSLLLIAKATTTLFTCKLSHILVPKLFVYIYMYVYCFRQLSLFF